jgi:hypothetical protein
MKNILLLSLFLISSTILIGQNRLSFNLQGGQSILLKTGTSLRSLADDDLYIGNFLWNRENYTIASLGLTYETPTLKVLGYDWYLMTDLNLLYRNYGQDFYNVFSISNDLYFPVIKKEQRFRIYLGIKNTYVISDFVNEQFRKDFPIYHYIYGGLILLDYEINDKLKIGWNIYADLKPPVTRNVIDDADYQTLEMAFKISYLLRK